MTYYSQDDKRAIEGHLPTEYRGRGHGFVRMLESVPVRVSVSGIRGKSSLTKLCQRAYMDAGFTTFAKQTGTDPVSWLNEHEFPIDRKGKKVVIDETMWEMKKHYPYDVAIVENQAITPYTMRLFNEQYVRATHLLVTNIRRDHQGDIARALPRLARAFGESANPGSMVICGEQDPELSSIVGYWAERRGAGFVNVAVPSDEYVPGVESVSILDKLLQHTLGTGLLPERRAAVMDTLRAHFTWKRSQFAGVRWFHGGEINDVDSTMAILRYLRRDEPGPVTFVAYFRWDRRDRTASFIEFLEEVWKWLERVYMAGDGADVVARRLSRKGVPLAVLPDNPDRASEFAERIAGETRGGRVMTIVNAVPPWPRRLAEAFSVPEAPATAAGRTIDSPHPPRRSA